MSLGCDVENIDILDGIDVVFCDQRSQAPKICSLTDFYPGIFPPGEKAKPKLEGGVKMDRGKVRGVRSAEQFKVLAKTGLVRDLRKKKT